MLEVYSCLAELLATIELNSREFRCGEGNRNLFGVHSRLVEDVLINMRSSSRLLSRLLNFSHLRLTANALKCIKNCLKETFKEPATMLGELRCEFFLNGHFQSTQSPIWLYAYINGHYLLCSLTQQLKWWLPYLEKLNWVTQRECLLILQTALNSAWYWTSHQIRADFTLNPRCLLLNSWWLHLKIVILPWIHGELTVESCMNSPWIYEKFTLNP